MSHLAFSMHGIYFPLLSLSHHPMRSRYPIRLHKPNFQIRLPLSAPAHLVYAQNIIPIRIPSGLDKPLTGNQPPILPPHHPSTPILTHYPITSPNPLLRPIEPKKIKRLATPGFHALLSCAAGSAIRDEFCVFVVGVGVEVCGVDVDGWERRSRWFDDVQG